MIYMEVIGADFVLRPLEDEKVFILNIKYLTIQLNMEYWKD